LNSPDHSKVIEHYEHYIIQLKCLQAFTESVRESIDLKQLEFSPVDCIMNTLRQFVEATFQFSSQHGLDLLALNPVGNADFTQNFGNFVKSEVKNEDTKVGLNPGVLRRQPEGGTMGMAVEPPQSMERDNKESSEFKAEEVRVKEEQILAGGGALAARKDPKETIELNVVDSESSEQGSLDGGDMTEQVAAEESNSPTVQGSDAETQSTEDVAESQLREILNYSCHTILGAGLDSIADSQLLYDTLIDIVDDFVTDVTEAAAMYGGEALGQDKDANPSSAGFGRGVSTGNDTLGQPSRNQYSGSDDEYGNELGGDDDGSRGPGQPFPLARGKGRGLRLPCPLRMRYPHIFSVRTHYTCSMTYFPTIGRLKWVYRLNLPG
jgi:hypothetical protein